MSWERGRLARFELDSCRFKVGKMPALQEAVVKPVTKKAGPAFGGAGEIYWIGWGANARVERIAGSVRFKEEFKR